MSWTQVAPNYWVSPQINEQDVQQAAAEGYQVIVCNRPDNESSDQINSDIIQHATKQAGLEFVFLPMNGPAYTSEDVAKIQQLNSDGKKVLAYCRSGNRSNILFNAAIS